MPKFNPSDLTTIRNASYPRQRASGCGRSYIALGKGGTRDAKALAAALGLRYIPRTPEGSTNCIYVGYDNCTGIESGRAEGMCQALKALGVSCYVSHEGD